ncbi:S-adenosyl-L-methionine-dependent methyltransferase [Aspergillus spinulosporus]
MDHDNAIFEQDKNFWDNYLKGRPRPPYSLFERIFSYHQAHDGEFGTVHDAGAGNGPYSKVLRSRFEHVIVSDIVPKNIELAQGRLGSDGYSFRAAKVEEADDIPAGSVDMVFATNIMHFPDQAAGMAAIAKQLKSGGTFACGTFGPARFEDAQLQDLWQRISYQGGREILKKAENPDYIIGVMARTQDNANVAPLSTDFFEPGAIRLHLNMGRGGIVSILPPEEAHRNTEPVYSGETDEILFEDEEGWSFETDVNGVKEHICSFPFVSENLDAFTDLLAELDILLGDGRLARGYWPAKLILATRR